MTNVSNFNNYPLTQITLESTVIMADLTSLKIKIETIKSKRQSLIKLLENPNLGTLKLDVSQALEELDELISELDQAF